MVNLMTISSSMQDYLEVILNISQEANEARITDIAEKLNVAKASVCQSINNLKKLGLVKQNSYGPVLLTQKGREMAEAVKKRHVILRKFMIEVLGVDTKTAEKDACLMEHVISTKTMQKLTEYLLDKNDVLPLENKNARIEKLKSINTSAVTELKEGQSGKVIRIGIKGVARRRITEMGITKGTEIKVSKFAPLGDPVEIIVKGYHLSIRKEEAAYIFVEVL